MFPIIVSLLVTFLFTEASLFADSDSLRYQKRGNYMEGIRGRLVSGELIELVSAKAFPAEMSPGEVGEYRLSFVSQGEKAPHITVRELQFQHGYWLDKVGELERQGRMGWEPGKAYEFSWSTRPVILEKNIGLHELGIVVRLDHQAGAVERVLPAVLSAASLSSATIQSYAFTFKTLGDARLSCIIERASAEGKIAKVEEPQCGMARGKQAQTIVWKPKSDTASGWYTLKITGYQVADNEPLEQLVHFMHQAQMPGAPISIK